MATARGNLGSESSGGEDSAPGREASDSGGAPSSGGGDSAPGDPVSSPSGESTAPASSPNGPASSPSEGSAPSPAATAPSPTSGPGPSPTGHDCCAICDEPYEPKGPRKPKILPCLHRVCLGCLEQLRRLRAEAQRQARPGHPRASPGDAPEASQPEAKPEVKPEPEVNKPEAKLPGKTEVKPGVRSRANRRGRPKTKPEVKIPDMTLLPDTILICPTCELRFEMLSDDLDALPTDMPAERKRLYLSAEPADWTRNPLTRSMRKAFFPARPLGEPVTRRHDNPPDVEEARAQAYLEAVRFLGVVVAIPMFLVFVNYYLPNVFMVLRYTLFLMLPWVGYLWARRGAEHSLTSWNRYFGEVIDMLWGMPVCTDLYRLVWIVALGVAIWDWLHILGIILDEIYWAIPFEGQTCMWILVGGVFLYWIGCYLYDTLYVQ